MDAASRDIDGLALPLDLCGMIKTFAADLNARVQSRINLEIELKDEVVVILVRAKKAVGSVNNRFAQNAVAIDRIFRRAALLRPAGEILAVEKLNPSLLGEKISCRRGQCDEKSPFKFV